MQLPVAQLSLGTWQMRLGPESGLSEGSCFILVAVLCGAFRLYDTVVNRKPYESDEFVMGNGRIEASEVAISAKLAGRVEKIYIEEGDLVINGQKLGLCSSRSTPVRRRRRST